MNESPEIPYLLANGRRSEAPTYDLHGPQGRVIRMICMSHIALPTFYQAAERVIADCPDGLVLQEGVMPPPEPATELIRLFRTAMRDGRLTAIEVARRAGLKVISQNGGFALPEDRTRDVDLPEEDIVASLERRGYDFDVLRHEAFQASRLRDVRDVLRNRPDDPMALQIAREIKASIAQSLLCTQQPPPRNDNERILFDVIYDERDARLLQELRDRSEHLIIPWGAHHIRTMTLELLGTREWEIDPRTVRYVTYYEKEAE